MLLTLELNTEWRNRLLTVITPSLMIAGFLLRSAMIGFFRDLLVIALDKCSYLAKINTAC